MILENSDFNINIRIDMRHYFNIYKPYSLKDVDLIKFEKQNIKKGELKKNRQFYFIAKGGGGSVSAVLVQLLNSDRQFWCCIKIVNMNSNLLEDKNILNPKFKEWRELDVLKKCSVLVLQKKTQNLPLSYGFRVFNTDNSSNKLFLYTELAHANLENWIKDRHTDSEWMSFLFQFWYSLHCLQTQLKLVHNDLRLPNILYHKVKPGGFWQYTVDNIKYFVPNHGDVFFITDFGSSETPNCTCFNSEKFYKDKLQNNTDLIYVHAMYQRVKVLALETVYTVDELKQFFNTPDLIKAYDKEYEMNKKRFDKNRFPAKFKLALIYYLVENDLFANQDSTMFPTPPEKTNSLLKELFNNNMSYKEVALLYNKTPVVAKRLDSPQQLIKKYLSEFTKVEPFSESFAL